MKNFHHILSIFLIIFVISVSAQQVDTEYDNQKKSILKMEFFSPLTGHTTFGYERYIKDWVSWEVKLGIIGLGVDNEDDYNGFSKNPVGILFRGGPKFKLNPDFVTRDLRGSHLLSGKYIRPEIVASVYSEDELLFNGAGDEVRRNYSSFAVLINYGRQYVLADIMSIDYHVGIGYGFDNYDGEDGGKYHHSHLLGDSSFPVAISAGFTIGVLLK